jgi:phenylacetate-coenzyme A ligase PaaK-like adenylate-forming protein
VFKLIRLGRRIASEGLAPQETSVERLVAGGESFADESRAYLAEQWGIPVYNTYGSTEGTMCGECTELAGLHVPEDLVHLDVYDPQLQAFVPDGECGRAVLTTLLETGSKCGTLLINYDTEDSTVVLSRERCACGRTHMRVVNPAREAETAWVLGTAINRIDVEAAVFQQENMHDCTGEYEAFLYDGEPQGSVVMQVGLECFDPATADKNGIADRFVARFLKHRQDLARHHADGTFTIIVTYTGPGGLELHHVRGRPRRLVDRRGG